MIKEPIKTEHLWQVLDRWVNDKAKGCAHTELERRWKELQLQLLPNLLELFHTDAEFQKALLDSGYVLRAEPQ